jgi:predicted outer membrane repeat protein
MIVRSQPTRLRSLRRHPIAACLAAAVAAGVPGLGVAQFADVGQVAASTVVQNCNDSGPGSLRAAYANAVDNETIDLTQLACSHITLGSALTDPVAAATVTLQGPGRDLLTIDGDGLYRVLVHRGSGYLHIDQLKIVNGHYSGAHGGCVYSAGGVEASGSTFSACVLDTAEPAATGGAIYAKGVVGLFDSTVSDSSANAPGDYNSRGGGIYSKAIVMARSTVSGNSAAKGGGIHASALVDIQDSTISGNYAFYGGALISAGSSSAHKIRNSTISGNRAKLFGGAIYADAVSIYNCTIVNNTTALSGAVGAGVFGGVAILQSSIVANNTSGNGLTENDLVPAGVFAGSNNLIMASTGPVPADTITVDPKLGPLQDNGGPTSTHALLPGSVAIGTGNNLLELDGDQRGAPFGRVDGASADIGAFEFADTVFGAGFESEVNFNGR